MAGILDFLGPVSELAGDVMDRVLPKKMDEETKARFKMEMQVALANQDDKRMQTALSAIIAEAKSDDRWTSRARPSFLYVMYIMILSSLPMGIVFAVSPETGADIAKGMTAWLGSIPDALYALFGTVALGYVASRGYEKSTSIKQGKRG